MKANDLMDAVGNIGDGYIEKYAACVGVKKEKTERRRFSAKEWIAAAACIALVLGLGFGSYAYAEAAEYKEASMFFEANGLSKEGLTRAEIKAVYRDITTESFTYGKTAEVIAHDMRTNSIQGWEILTGNAAPSDVRDMWELLMERFNTMPHYEVDWTNDERTVNGVEYIRPKGSLFRKCLGNEVIWTYRTTDMRFYFGFEVSDGVLATGIIKEELAIPVGQDHFNEPSKPAIMKFTNDGERVWFVTWDNGGVEQQISSVIEEADGSYTVISQNRDDENKIFAVCVTRISKDGELLSSTVNPTEKNLWVCDAVAFDGGYAAIGFDNDESIRQSLVRFDKDGTLSGEYEYSREGRRYRMSDVAVFGGKLYISASLEDLGSIFAAYPDDEAASEAVKEALTAVLLICREDGGEPELFYEVKGGAHGEIEIVDGALIWTVDRVISIERRSVYGSGISGKGERIRYRFLEDGTLDGVENKGDMNIGWYLSRIVNFVP